MKRVLYIKKLRAIILLIVFFIFSSGVSINYNDKLSNVEFITYTVLPGDTIWSIAQEYENKINRTNFVNEIERINKINRDLILPGDKLAIPIYK